MVTSNYSALEMYAVATGAEGEVSSEKDQHAWHGHPDTQELVNSSRDKQTMVHRTAVPKDQSPGADQFLTSELFRLYKDYLVYVSQDILPGVCGSTP